MANWQKDVDELFESEAQKSKLREEEEKKTKAEVERFYSTVVKPAFEEVKAKLEEHGKQVDVSVGQDYASIVVDRNDYNKYEYRIKVIGAFPQTEQVYNSEGQRHRGVGRLRDSSSGYSVTDITKEEIINDLLKEYRRHVQRRA
jgi:hypothetical protein